MKGATVCRRHGVNAKARRNAEQLTVLREFHAALPFLQGWTDQLVAEHRRGTEGLADGDRPRRCRAKRKNGDRCKAWAIRGGFVCRAHGGAAPQVRAKAQQRVRAAEIYREYAAERRYLAEDAARKSLRQACYAARHLTAGITGRVVRRRCWSQDRRHGTEAPVSPAPGRPGARSASRLNCGT